MADLVQRGAVHDAARVQPAAGLAAPALDGVVHQSVSTGPSRIGRGEQSEKQGAEVGGAPFEVGRSAVGGRLEVDVDESFDALEDGP